MVTETVATGSGLTRTQSHALFDILTHHEVYAEIQDFRYPDSIKKYGPPFQDDVAASSSPILQSLLSKFVLKLPGLRDVSPDFWKVRLAELIEDFCKAELSESYDKGILGVRKTLATAMSALIEYPARGVLGGVADELEKRNGSQAYDPKNPDDVIRSWHVALREMIHEDFLDQAFAKAAETDDLKQHPMLLQCMHEYVIVNLASLMHYAFILSPEGPAMLRLIQSVHSLIPYVVLRQTLKIGNVATMISAMMRVVLAKASISSVTNWMGLTTGADEGMNLMQQIISQVLNWDKRELRKRADKIEKCEEAPPKEVLKELQSWINTRSREEHEECRRQSHDQGMSIVAVIITTSSASVEMSKTQHAKALEYLALQLGVRDRDEIIKVMCQRIPDHYTAATRNIVDAYTPMIREVHKAVNLADTVWDSERFLTDMLKISQPSKPKSSKNGDEGRVPTVEDYVDLLHRHQQSSHKFLHQVAKNGKEVTAWWQEYVHMATAQFKNVGKQPPNEATASDSIAAGGAREAVEKAFADLKQVDQEAVKKELDAWAKYLHALHAASASRIKSVLTGEAGGTPYGPGAYLARWQHLLDTTMITPGKRKGPVRWGASKSVREEGRKDVTGENEGFVGVGEAEKVVSERTPAAPEINKTVELLGKRFREIISKG